MRDELNHKEFHEAIDSTLSGLRDDPWLAQRVVNYERKDEIMMKPRKLSIGLLVAMIIMLITVTALALLLLTPTEIVEQVAVPIAQKNNRTNYSYSELSELIKALNENGISLDEGTTILQAFNSEHGYWEGNTIREICKASFGENERSWSIEQKHWYGEIMVSVGAWDKNIYLVPEENDMSITQAHIRGAKALNDTFQADLPSVSNSRWQIQENFELIWDKETDSFPPEMAEWTFWYVDLQTDEDAYSISLTRNGQVIRLTKEKQEASFSFPNPYPKEEDAISQYGSIMHYWPHEVQTDVYGEPYTIASQTEYSHALEIAENAISDKKNVDALTSLGDYKVGYMLKVIRDHEYNTTEMHWDFMFTTDTEFLSDGYRVQFIQSIDLKTGQEEVREISIEDANMGNG